MYPLISVATDQVSAPALQALKFEHAPVVQLQIGDPHTVLAMCVDGALLAIYYAPLQELLSLLRQQRLLPAMLQLRERSPWAYLVIGGKFVSTNSGKTEVDGNVSGWDWAAVQGALLSVQELGIGVLSIIGDKYVADAIYRLARRERSTLRVRPPRDALFVRPGEDVLLALPGIGDERVTAILQYTNGNVAAALDALCDPRQTVPGIGPKVKAEIRKALGLGDSTRLAMLGISEEEALRAQEDSDERIDSSHPGAGESRLVAA